ncbi:hypothetical protein AAHE18_14G238700 [Arachis hypogaea]
MGRPKEERYWNQVTKEADRTWKCKRCGRQFSGGASRIKAHVDRIPGKGISICSASPDDNHLQPQSQETANPMNPREGSAAVAQSNNDDFVSDEINKLHELLITLEENDVKGELEWLKSQGKQSKKQVDDLLNELQELRNKSCENYPHDLGQIQQSNAQLSELKRRKPVVLSNEVVGEDFERNVEKMWELVRDEKVLMIGIHGMGGVGKTCLATHLETQIKREGTFNHVIWVTVSREYTISKLQEDIAEAIGVKLGRDQRTRAAHLSSALSEKGKWVFILDDVWKFIDLQKVGIPRLELFLVGLGEDRKTHILKIAESIARECGGLPLAINVMARTMKDIEDIHQWRHALNKLRQKMEEEVFQVLKLSYDSLRHKSMQNSFLLCALYSEIHRDDKMIMMLVDSGAINGRRSLGEIFCEGHTIFNELEDHSLLLPHSKILRMKNSMRNMACRILNESQRCIVRYDQRLFGGIPHLLEWSADLDIVSLDTNRIEQIPAGISPNCPRLSTLILSNNHIISIPECFFTHMKSLAILDLSQNRSLTSLPDSLSDLSCLVSLLLHGCKALKKVPPLGRLQKLSRLVISGTSVEVVPGLEMLTNLTWLDLSYNKKLRLKAGSVLRDLTNLQCLNLFDSALLNVELEDVQGMISLEYFVAGFDDSKSYNNYVASIWNRGSTPKCYLLYLGDISDSEWILKAYDVIDPNCKDLAHLLPKDITKLSIDFNTCWKSLCDALSNNASSSLMNIEVEGCTKMKSLFCLFGRCSFCSNLNNLQSLQLDDLESLTVICKEDVPVTNTITQPLKSNSIFSHLMRLNISYCHGITTLVTAALLPQLQNLQTLSAVRCYSLKEIFDERVSTISLPNLTTLELCHLPELEILCKGTIISTYLPKLEIDECPKFKNHHHFQVSSS